MNKDLAATTPLERRVKDTATEAAKLLADHDKSINALAAFQRENAKEAEARIHPAEYAHMVLAEYAKSILQ